MAKGHGGTRPNSGRKSLKDELGLQKILKECFTLADRQAVIKKLVSKAKSGSIRHAELLLAYTWGKPKQVLDIGLDDDTDVFENITVTIVDGNKND